MKLLTLVLLISTFSSLTLTEVVKDLTKTSCSKFFIRSPKQKHIITPTVFSGSQYKQICQRWENKYTFATLYNTEQRIPVYSAYTYSWEGPKLEWNKWKNEPQLENMNNGPEMKLISDDEMDKFSHQAVNRDYKESNESTNISYTRGHVFPKSYAGDRIQRESTFTFTNIAPQTKGNNNNWSQRVEEPMKDTINKRCKAKHSNPAFIVTGVVLGNNWIAIKRNNETIEKGINIPSFYWTAFCCYVNQTKIFSKAYLLPQDEANESHEHINMTVENLNQRLSSLYNKDFKVFSKLCLS